MDYFEDLSVLPVLVSLRTSCKQGHYCSVSQTSWRCDCFCWNREYLKSTLQLDSFNPG